MKDFTQILMLSPSGCYKASPRSWQWLVVWLYGGRVISTVAEKSLSLINVLIGICEISLKI
jgi:hypothetical protein